MTDAVVDIETRGRQMFPVLTAAELARMRRFGSVRRFARGERLVTAGEPVPGMFVVLNGRVTIILRTGVGQAEPFFPVGPGQFLGEVASLSHGVALVDAHAEEDTERC